MKKKLPLKLKCNLDEIFSGNKLDGYSGADLASLVRETQMICLRKTINKQKEKNKCLNNDNKNLNNNFDNDNFDFRNTGFNIENNLQEDLEEEEIFIEKEDFENSLRNIMPSVSKEDKFNDIEAGFIRDVTF